VSGRRKLSDLQGYKTFQPQLFDDSGIGEGGNRNAQELPTPTISELAGEINLRAQNHPFGGLQKLRQELKGLSRLPTLKIFGRNTIFDDYAFHVGGRTELQFNIGLEKRSTEEFIRYGVAFSLEPTQTLPDIDVLLPRVKKFNEFLRVHPDELGDLGMWRYYNDELVNDWSSPAPIPPEIFKPHTFVFMGELQSSTDVNYDKILDTFDRLLPLYQYVEGNDDGFPSIAETSGTFVFVPGCPLKRNVTTSSIPQQQLDIVLRHNELQVALHRHLSLKHGANSVSAEQGTGTGTRIDVVVRLDSGFWFYEIKTASTVRACVREALAQLVEYSFWPGAQEAKRLIIVGEAGLDSTSREFLEALRGRFGLPIYYEQLDMSSESLVS
jgi:hypothetical protein